MRKTKMSLRASLVLWVFLIFLFTMIVVSTLTFAMLYFNVGSFFFRSPHFGGPLIFILIFSVIIGSGITIIVSNRILKPIKQLIAAMHEVSLGNFNVQLDETNIPELKDLTQSFNVMVEDLSGIETLRNDFVSSFSHELKTPIVSIRGFAKLLRDENISKQEHDEYVEIIIQESDRLVSLSSNILNLTKLENTGIIGDKVEFSLDEQIRRTCSLMEINWTAKNITVDFDLEEIKYVGNEDLLQQVWVNLLDNAVKFTPAQGIINVSLCKSEEGCTFEIVDTGIGMDEATIQHIFDKFYQNDSSRAGKGNGLGLSTVKQIVMLCNGEITVKSELEQGTTFTVFLPWN